MKLRFRFLSPSLSVCFDVSVPLFRETCQLKSNRKRERTNASAVKSFHEMSVSSDETKVCARGSFDQWNDEKVRLVDALVLLTNGKKERIRHGSFLCRGVRFPAHGTSASLWRSDKEGCVQMLRTGDHLIFEQHLLHCSTLYNLWKSNLFVLSIDECVVDDVVLVLVQYLFAEDERQIATRGLFSDRGKSISHLSFASPLHYIKLKLQINMAEGRRRRPSTPLTSVLVDRFGFKWR